MTIRPPNTTTPALVGRLDSGRALAGITVFLLAIALWIFSQGLAGGLYFDDLGNLAPLAQVRSFDAAMQFVFSGLAGPSGRSVSLASFALQAQDWPENPQHFIGVNIAIHLVNGALVAWFSLLLANQAALEHKVVFSSLLTALWLLSPLQVSPVLFIVQRMTLLAGTFTLLGFIFYMLGRTPRTSGRIAWLWIFLAFGMTLPAALSKENGILLPGFLLILEFFLFRGNPLSSRASLRNMFLIAWFSVIVLFGLIFMFHYWPSFAASFAAKGHTWWQHAATEARVLVHYLMQFILPNMLQFGPFHDDFPISRHWHEPRALVAAAMLLLTAGAAWWSRMRCGLFAAGIFIFLWGHVLESSVIPLELYFEHRNYIPILGLAMALVGVAASVPQYRKLAWSGLGGVLVLGSFVSYQYASIWGQRNLAAQYWYSERPQSVRAVLFYADRLGEQQRWPEVDQLVSKAWRTNPENMWFAMPMLYVTCRASSERLAPPTLGELTHAMRNGEYTGTSAIILHRVLKMVASGQCPAFSLDDVQSMLDALADNPRFQVEAETVADFMIIRAKTLFAQGHRESSAELLAKALNLDFRLSIALQAAKLHLEAGKPSKAEQMLQTAREHLPSNPWLRSRWLHDIEISAAAIARNAASGIPVPN